MTRNPILTLDPRFTHVVLRGDEVALVGEDGFHLFHDAVVGDVIRLVDGTRRAVDVARHFQSSRQAEVHYVLLILEEQGIVRPADHESGSDPRIPAGGVIPLGIRLKDAWRSVPEGQGAAVLPMDWVDAGVQLILAEDYLHPGVAERVRGSLSQGVDSVVLSRLGAHTVWVGPLVCAGASPCVSCLTARLQLNFPARTLVYPNGRSRGDHKVVPLPRQLPDRAFEALAGHLGEGMSKQALTNNLRSVSLDGSPDADHAVARLPQCPDCGDPRLTVPGAAIRLEGRQKAAGSGSGFRTVMPDVTLQRVGPMLSAITGVARSISKVHVKGCDSVYVYSANHAQHYGRAGLADLKEEVRDHSGGKGWTDLDARVSAICESLERSSSIYRGDEPSRLAALSGMGPDAVAPSDLMHFSERQFRDRAVWNEEHGGGFQWISEPYDDEPIDWSPVRSLVTGETRWVPSAFIYYGFPGEGGRFCDGDSNGLASGNCIEEAVLQGLLEVVERDAVALWWYNRAERPGVALPTSDDAWCTEVQAHYRVLGRDLWALDLTTDVGVPVVVAVSALDGREVIFGFGAHLDARVALRRAITEVNQMLTSVVLEPEDRKAKLGRDFPDVLAWWDTHTLDTDPYLIPGDVLSMGGDSEVRESASDDLKDDILECVDRVSSAGYEVLAHDLTRPDIAFPVVKVIVPGFRHFWRRLGPGRLYDVPVRVGWRSQPLSEAEMNPVSLFV